MLIFFCNMLFTILILALFELSIILHELGHAFAMRQCGVRVARISLFGLPGLGFISVPFTIRLPIKAQWLPDTEWVIHPLLPLGAYVEPNEEDAARVSRAEICTFRAWGRWRTSFSGWRSSF